MTEKTDFIFFEKNACHKISTKIFPSNFDNSPPKCFIFFKRKSNFVRKQTFSERIFLQDRPTFGALSNQGFSNLCSVANTMENLSENEFTNKKQHFCLWRKYLSYNFHLLENAYNRVFIQFSVRIQFSVQLIVPYPQSILLGAGYCFFV